MGDALHVLHALVLEDRRRWGEAAADFQRDDAAAILASPTLLHFLTRPRGGSKTTDVAGIALALLLEVFGPGDQGHVFAVDADQAGEVMRAAAGFVARTAELQGLVEVQSRRIVVASGAAFVVVAADAASAFGIRSRAIIFDEFAQLGATPEPKRLWEAAFSAQPKLNALLVLLTTAGDPASWQHRVLEQAMSSEQWRVHEVAGPVPWISPAALAEQRRMLTESQYARLHRNQWLSPEDRLTTLDAVRECVRHAEVLEPRPGVRYVVGLDIGIVNDRTAIAVAHAEPGADGPMVVVDRVVRFIPSKRRPVDLAEVEQTVALLSRSYNRAKVKTDPYQAVLMAQSLRRRGVTVDEFAFSQASVGRLALNLYRLLRDRKIALPDDDLLLDELASVQLREVGPNTFRMDHATGAHDDQAIALGLAALELAGLVQSGPGVVVPRSTRTIAKPKPASRSVRPGGPMLTFSDGSRRPVRRGSVQWKLGGWR